MRIPIRRLALVAAAASAILIPAAPAHAALEPSCDGQILERPFEPWLDAADYTLAPDGTFEDGAVGWRLAGSELVADNEHFYVHAPGEVNSLELEDGESARTPAMCVGTEHPVLRLFTKRVTGWTGSTLIVEVLFHDAFGSLHAVPIAALSGPRIWQPTVQVPVVANLLALPPSGSVPVAFRFTARDATWRIDDVYIDPYRRS